MAREPAQVGDLLGAVLEAAARSRARASIARQQGDNAEVEALRDHLRAVVPRRFWWAQFGAADLGNRVDLEAGKLACVRELALAGQNLLLIGPSGTGKTSLACAILREVVQEAASVAARGGALTREHSRVLSRGHRVLYAPAWRLASASAEHGLGTQPPIVDDARRASLLVLDELGSELGRASMHRAVVPELLHERHAEMRQTIICTFLSKDECVAAYGAGVARRLAEAEPIILGVRHA